MKNKIIPLYPYINHMWEGNQVLNLFYMDEKYFLDMLCRLSANIVIFKCKFSVTISCEMGVVGYQNHIPCMWLAELRGSKIQYELQRIFHYAWQSSP